MNTTPLSILEAGVSDRMSDSELWGAFCDAERANDRELLRGELPWVGGGLWYECSELHEGHLVILG